MVVVDEEEGTLGPDRARLGWVGRPGRDRWLMKTMTPRKELR